jgi:hypothetical protein
MRRLNPRRFPFEEEALDAFVAEALEHRASVSRYDTRVKLCIECIAGRCESDQVHNTRPGPLARGYRGSQEVCSFVGAASAGGIRRRVSEGSSPKQSL